jgi:hypothetical protein
MTAERWTQAVRRQLRLGRILPLGGAQDGAWISEEAAGAVLRRAAPAVPGVRLGSVRIGLADPADVREPVVPPPPSALPPGPLRVTAEFAASVSEPLPVTAERLRAVLLSAAEGLGLTLEDVDLRVTELLDEAPQPAPEPARAEAGALRPSEPGPASVRPSGPEPDAVRPPEPDPAEPAGGGPDEERAAEAALSVPGVSRLTGALGRPVHVEERQAGTNTLPRRHVRVELAVRADHRAVEVAREVRATVERALPDHPTVAVLVTGVG